MLQLRGVMKLTAKICAMLSILAFTARASDQTNADIEKKLAAMPAAEKANWKLAIEKMDAADKIGRAWCEGSDEVTTEKLKEAFASDDTVYNVVFERKKKDKRGAEDSTLTLFVLNDGRNSGTIMVLNFVNDDMPDVHMEYAFVEGRTIPVVRAIKNIAAKEGDSLNLGGSITVLVRAKEDAHFKNARKPASPKEEKAGDKK